jgi:hypothetical protein
MRKSSLVVRVLAVALALFQVSAGPVAAIADATLPLRGPQSHIEDHTQRSCAPSHPDDCTLCRTLSLSATPTTPAVLVGAGTARAGCRAAAPHVVPSAERLGLRQPRAPPAA